MASDGASPNERLLFASKTDAVEMVQEVFDTPGEGSSWDVNACDGLGMTALHYAASVPSPDVLELLLEHEGTDVDPQNKLEKQTPLHLAILKVDHPEGRYAIVELLLEAGADPRIKDKYNRKPIDLLPTGEGSGNEDEEKLKKLLKEHEIGGGGGGQAMIDMGDVVVDSDGEEGSGSDSD